MAERLDLELNRVGNVSPQNRRQRCVARQHIINDVLRYLKNSPTRKSKHNFLFLGARGLGKTFLLSRIEEECRESSLRDIVIVARFPEESYSTISFADFLRKLVQILNQNTGDSVWQTVLNTQEKGDEFSSLAVEAIREYSNKTGKTIVVMLENVDQIFSDQFRSREDVAALRKFFMGENGCTLIATAQETFSDASSVDSPLYDFFDTQRLQPFKREEAIELLLALRQAVKPPMEDFSDQEPLLLAFYDICEGIPRWLSVVCLCLLNGIRNSGQILTELMNQATDEFQEVIESVSPQEAAILSTLAQMRPLNCLPRTPNRIADILGLSQQHTSSLLKRLAESGLVSSEPSAADKRSREYQLINGMLGDWFVFTDKTTRLSLEGTVKALVGYYSVIAFENESQSEVNEDSDSNCLQSVVTRKQLLQALDSWRDQWRIDRSGPFVDEITLTQMSNTTWTCITATVLLNLEKSCETGASLRKITVDQMLNRTSLLVWAGHEDEAIAQLDEILLLPDTSEVEYDFCFSCLADLIESSNLATSGQSHARATIFLSYKWGNQQRHKQVQNGFVRYLQILLGRAGIEVIRDATHIPAGGSIEAHADRVLDVPCMISVISPDYLTSKYCMVDELFKFYQKCGKNRERFQQGIVPILIRNAEEKLANFQDVLDYWQSEADKLSRQIAGISAQNRKRTEEIRHLTEHLPDMLDAINDMVLPRGYGAVIGDNFQTILSAIQDRLKTDDSKQSIEFEAILKSVANDSCEQIIKRVNVAVLSSDVNAYIKEFEAGNRWLANLGKFASSLARKRMKLYLSHLVNNDHLGRIPGGSQDLAKQYLEQARLEPDSSCRSTQALMISLSYDLGLASLEELAACDHVVAQANYVWSLLKEKKFNEAEHVLSRKTLGGRFAECAALLQAEQGQLDKMIRAIDVLKGEASSGGETEQCRYARSAVLAGQVYFDTWISKSKNFYTTTYPLSPTARQELTRIKILIEPSVRRAGAQSKVTKGIDLLACELAFRMAIVEGDIDQSRYVAQILARSEPVSQFVGVAMRMGFIDPNLRLCQLLKKDWGHITPLHIEFLSLLTFECDAPKAAVEELSELLEVPLKEEDKSQLSAVVLELATSQDRYVRDKAYSALVQLCGTEHHYLRMAEAKWELEACNADKALDLLNDRPKQDDPDWLSMRAHTLQQLGRDPEALEDLQQLCLLTSHPVALWRAAELARKLGRRDYVIATLKRLKLDPQQLEKATEYLAHELVQEGSSESLAEAAELFEDLSERSPNRPELMLNAASCYVRLRKYEECLSIVLGLHQRYPGNCQAYLLHASVLELWQKPEEAFAILDDAKVKSQFWTRKEFLLKYMELGYKTNHELEAHKAMMRIAELEQHLPEDARVMKSADLDTVVKMLTSRDRFHDELNQWILQGRIPWTAPAFESRRPFYAAWRYRIQECNPHTNTGGRAQLHTYATNGFHAVDTENGKDLEPLVAPGKGAEVVADISALVTWHELGILSSVCHFYKQVHVPAIYREIEEIDYRGLQPHQLSKVDIAHKLYGYHNDDRLTTKPTIPKDCLRVGRSYEPDCDWCVGDFANWLEANEVIDSEKLKSIPVNEYSPSPPESQSSGSRQLAVVITHDALELLESCNLLEPATKSKRCRIVITAEAIQEIRANHRAYENQAELLRDCDKFWAAIRSSNQIRFANPTGDLSEAESAEVEETNSIRRALAAYDLAKVRKLPLIAEDRVLISVRLSESAQDSVTACSTAELIDRLYESHVIKQQQRLQLKIQLIRWRYRNVLFDEMDLVELAKKMQATRQTPDRLQEVAKYVQDCMLDFGQFGGDEPVEPVRSIATQLYMHWTKVTARFVNQLWTGNDFSNPQAETLTRWAVDSLLPCNAKSVRPDLQVNFATAQYKLLLVHLLNQRAFLEDQSRSAEMMRVLHENLPLSDGEFWMAVFELIKAEPGTPSDLVDEETWTMANRLLKRSIARHALAQFADEEGGYQLYGRGIALMEASGLLRKHVQEPAPDLGLLESLQQPDHPLAMQLKCTGPWYFGFEPKERKAGRVVQVTELLTLANAEARRAAVEYFRIVAVNRPESFSLRTKRLLVQKGRAAHQKRAVNWYPIAEELLYEIDNDWSSNLSGFRQCLQEPKTLDGWLKEYWKRCITPLRHPAASAPASAFSLVTNEREFVKALAKLRSSKTGIKEKTTDYLSQFSHLPLSSKHSLAVLVPKSSEERKEYVQELISIASSGDYLQAYHGCLALVSLWDGLSEADRGAACECLSKFIVLSMTYEPIDHVPDDAHQRHWHCLRSLALHFINRIPLYGPEIGEDNSTSLAWWLAGRLTNALMEDVEASKDKHARYKILWNCHVGHRIYSSIEANKYYRHGAVSRPFALLSTLEKLGGPFLASLISSLGTRFGDVHSRLSLEAAEYANHWVLANSMFFPTGSEDPNSIVLRNIEHCITRVRDSWLEILKQHNENSDDDKIKQALEAIRHQANFSDPIYIEESLTNVASWQDKELESWLDRLNLSAANRQLDTDALYRTLSDVEIQKQWLPRLTVDQITLLCSTLIQIQASSLYNPRYTVDMPTASEQPTREFGGERWTFELPYLFINWLDQPSSDPACRQRLVHACIWSALVGGVPLAIQQLLDRPDRNEYENILHFHRDHIDSLKNQIPHWAWSQIRWALALLPKGE